MKRNSFSLIIAMGVLMGVACASNDGKTLGIGVYPGNPTQNFAPETVPGGKTYRNLALNRITWHSSSIDYNLTGQLATDGIVGAVPAPWTELRSNGEILPKRQRDFLTDLNPTALDVEGESSVYEIIFHNSSFTADKVIVAGSSKTARVSVECAGQNGIWQALGSAAPVSYPDQYSGENRLIPHSAEWVIPFPGERNFCRFRVTVDNPGKGRTSIREVFFYHNGEVIDTNPNACFVSNWKSEGSSDEWIMVDLGGPSRIDSLSFHWVSGPRSCTVQISRDGKKWADVVRDPADYERIRIPSARGRYVRALLHGEDGDEPFELGELEVFGTGGVTTKPSGAPERLGNRQILSGGAWKLKRCSADGPDGAALSSAGFDDSAWMDATVPGTVLASYVNAGAVPEPNTADYQLYASDSYFRSDFWYRTSFRADADTETPCLTFKGVSAAADVYLNGQYVGKVKSAFRETVLPVSGILRSGDNYLAVLVHCNKWYGTVKEQNAYTPSSNGGIVGWENPTMHATIGWDWIPTVRGRGQGIYDEVRLDFRGPVMLEDPFVRTELPLPDTSRAKVYAQMTLKNLSGRTVSGTLDFKMGDAVLQQAVTLRPGLDSTVRLSPFDMEHPALWWPRGYGEQNLYRAAFAFTEEGAALSDSLSLLTGVRQMDYRMEPYEPQSTYYFKGRDNNRRLSAYVNGRRFVGFGGNWGFPEQLLRYGAREYDIAVAYHADMNFTFIRNWVGMTGSDAFYEACDRHGIMIWQDFWLANPSDGPDPLDSEGFSEASRQYVRHIRNHPGIALYVGRNEGYPPKELDDALAEIVAEEHPGLYYIPHSGADGVSGGGPYRAKHPKEYFDMFGADKVHSERGMPNVMNYENLARALGEENLEPVSTLDHPNVMYGLHDYCLGRKDRAAQQCHNFNNLVEKGFGEPADAREFARLAQWVNYDGYRAMFEARSTFRRGLLLWMSHPAWPSLVWQTYDYYLEPTAAYFGCKKACEPIHILLNSLKGSVEAVNYHAGDRHSLTARAEILDMMGKPVWNRECSLDLYEDSTAVCFPLEVPEDITEVYFIRLTLSDADGGVLSRNFYWQGREEGNFRALKTLPKPSLRVSTSRSAEEGAVCLRTVLRNTGKTPALMLRLKVTDSVTGDLVLPVWYEDNYFFLMPGEEKTVTARIRTEDCHGKPRVQVESLI